MLQSYEIIDPSNHIMIDKSSDMNLLIQDNKKLKITTQVVIGLLLLTLLAIITYLTSRPNQEEK